MPCHVMNCIFKRHSKTSVLDFTGTVAIELDLA